MNETLPRAKPLVIYHADCDDGLTAAWCVMDAYRSVNQEVELYAAKYQQPPPDVTGRFVIIVDFSYKRPVLLEMAEKAHRIEIYDHHKSAQEDLADLEHPNLLVTFDMLRSGAGIAWDEFHGEGEESEPRPWFVNYVEDNDLWRHKLPDCQAVLEYLRSFPYSERFAMYDEWVDAHGSDAIVPQEVLVHGAAIRRAKEVLVQQALTFAHREEILIGDGPYQGPISALVCNVPFFLSSDVAGALAEINLKETGVPLGITYYQREDRNWSLSFRSRGDLDFDVSKLALSFGGGGHKAAAGATVKVLPWAQLYKLEVDDRGQVANIQPIAG